jgi:hypothetical protein
MSRAVAESAAGRQHELCALQPLVHRADRGAPPRAGRWFRRRRRVAVAGASPSLPEGLLIRVTHVAAQGRGLLVEGTPAMLNQAIRGRWNFRVPVRASRALLARARPAAGVRLSLKPFPVQARLLARQRARQLAARQRWLRRHHRHGGRARIADEPIVGPQPKGRYVAMNNFDLGPLPGSGGRMHLFLTGYAAVNLGFSVGTHTRDCPQNSCPHTAWHVEANFGLDLQKVQLSLAADGTDVSSKK